MRRIILVEGGEGSGKTTLCKKLVSHGFTYVKQPTPRSVFEGLIMDANASVGEKAAAALLDMINRVRTTSDNLVMDRGPLSLIAYQSPILLASLVRMLDASWVIRQITDIVYLDVDYEVGFSRELVKNAVSLKHKEFHQQVNARLRDFAKMHRDWCSTTVRDKWAQHKPSSDVASIMTPNLAWMPWTENLIAIDTNETNCDATYLEVLEGLGLAAGTP